MAKKIHFGLPQNKLSHTLYMRGWRAVTGKRYPRKAKRIREPQIASERPMLHSYKIGSDSLGRLNAQLAAIDKRLEMTLQS